MLDCHHVGNHFQNDTLHWPFTWKVIAGLTTPPSGQIPLWLPVGSLGSCYPTICQGNFLHIHPRYEFISTLAQRQTRRATEMPVEIHTRLQQSRFSVGISSGFCVQGAEASGPVPSVSIGRHGGERRPLREKKMGEEETEFNPSPIRGQVCSAGERRSGFYRGDERPHQ
ncbi:uncharacterized protein LOC144079045 [Stigmatopora argus]